MKGQRGPMGGAVVVHVEALDLSALPVARRGAVSDAFVRELQTLIQGGTELAGRSDRPSEVGPGIQTRLGSGLAPPQRVGGSVGSQCLRALSSPTPRGKRAMRERVAKALAPAKASDTRGAQPKTPVQVSALPSTSPGGVLDRVVARGSPNEAWTAAKARELPGRSRLEGHFSASLGAVKVHTGARGESLEPHTVEDWDDFPAERLIDLSNAHVRVNEVRGTNRLQLQAPIQRKCVSCKEGGGRVRGADQAGRRAFFNELGELKSLHPFAED